MKTRSRADRLAVHVSPSFFRLVPASRSAWYETEEEIEAGLAWGRRKAVLLRWVRRQMGRRLSLRERRCIELCFFEGRSYVEAAAITGTNPSSAQRAVERSLRRLRKSVRRRWSRSPGLVDDSESVVRRRRVSG
jgi:DNA-directed RNA polymerase specialized sigma24 family protein